MGATRSDPRPRTGRNVRRRKFRTDPPPEFLRMLVSPDFSEIEHETSQDWIANLPSNERLQSLGDSRVLRPAGLKNRVTVGVLCDLRRGGTDSRAAVPPNGKPPGEVNFWFVKVHPFLSDRCGEPPLIDAIACFTFGLSSPILHWPVWPMSLYTG